MDYLLSFGDSVSSGSSKHRLRIFREIHTNLTISEMSAEIASSLVDTIFGTLYIYDDKVLRKVVDDVLVTALNDVSFIKSFAAALVQCMEEKQLKLQSHTGCYVLFKWSCILLTNSQFASLSKNALSRIAFVQALVLHIVMQASFRKRRACKRKMIRLLSESPDIYRLYMEELKEGRIPFKDAPEFVQIMLEFSVSNPTFFDGWKGICLDMYVKVILNVGETPDKDLSEAFCPLLSCLEHDEFKNIVVRSFVEMLKKHPQLVLESVGVLLKTTILDLSKYAVEILSVVLPQARHADELRRLAALDIIRCLSKKTSNPAVVISMFIAMKSVIGGSEGRLAFPYQKVGMINALKGLSDSAEGVYLTKLSSLVCAFLLSCYKEDGNEEVKLATLSALGLWAAKSADAVKPELVSLLTYGLKEKEVIRRGHLRCLRVMSEKANTVMKMSSFVLPLVQLVKTGFTKAAQRYDGIHALLILARITAVNVKAAKMILFRMKKFGL